MTKRVGGESCSSRRESSPSVNKSVPARGHEKNRLALPYLDRVTRTSSKEASLKRSGRVKSGRPDNRPRACTTPAADDDRRSVCPTYARPFDLLCEGTNRKLAERVGFGAARDVRSMSRQTGRSLEPPTTERRRRKMAETAGFGGASDVRSTSLQTGRPLEPSSVARGGRGDQALLLYFSAT